MSTSTPHCIGPAAVRAACSTATPAATSTLTRRLTGIVDFGTLQSGLVVNPSSDANSSVGGLRNVGGVIGALGSGVIHNVQSQATVTGTNGTGGIVGSAFGGTIDASTATAVVNGAGNAGGFVGVIAGPVTIESSTANSITNATRFAIGGFVGAMLGGGTITNSQASGRVSGYAFVGGFAGSINPDTATGVSGTITGSAVLGGAVSATSTDPNADNPVGGFVGFAGAAQLNNNTVDSTTTVAGFNDVGGVAGALIDGSTLSLGTTTGPVSSANGVSIGGLVGHSLDAIISNSSTLASSRVSGGNNVGGIIGRAENATTLTGVTSNSTVTGQGSVGGMAGRLIGGSTLAGSIANGSVTASGIVVGGAVGGGRPHCPIGIARVARKRRHVGRRDGRNTRP